MTLPKMTKAERGFHDCMVHNLAQEVAYRADRYNECKDIRTPIAKRRRREMMTAAKNLAEAYGRRPSDKALAYFYGPSEVQRRNKLLHASDHIIPFKRDGRPGRGPN